MNRFEFYSRVETFKNSLQHYGIKGQKHGVRRWQNFDGTFNEEGKIRYFGKKNNDEKIGSIFNKKNVKNIDKYRTYNNEEMLKDEKEFMELNSQSLTKNANIYAELFDKLKKDTDIPNDFIEKYYLYIKSDIAEDLQKKYPNIAPNNIIRQYGDNDEEYYYPTFYNSQENINKINELKSKRDKYPENSAKWNKINSEIEREEYRELISNSKQAIEFYKDVDQYIKDNYEQIKIDALDQYARDPNWDLASEATKNSDGPDWYDGNIKINDILREAAKTYDYVPNKDKYDEITLDKDFNSKDAGKMKIKIQTEDFYNDNATVKEMKRLMKNNEKMIKNFDFINTFIQNEIADQIYDDYCDSMELNNKTPLSYEKFLNYIGVQSNYSPKDVHDIKSGFGNKDNNSYSMVYYSNVPGFEDAYQVEFDGSDPVIFDIWSLD